MKRNTLNFIVDAISALVVLGMTVTGLVIRFVLPPGSGRGRVLWGWDRHGWGDLHFWLAVAAGALVVVHVALHWQWICVTAARFVRHGRGEHGSGGAVARNMAGGALMVGLAGLLAGFVWVARVNVKAIGEGGEHRLTGEPLAQRGAWLDDEAGEIRGSMTLGEAAAIGGMPAEQLRARLGLPANVSADERLGRLRQQYGFTMDQVREIVASAHQEAGVPPRR